MSKIDRTSPDDDTEDPSTSRLKQDIEETREGLSETVAILEERLSPSQLRATLREEVQEVEEKVRSVLSEQMSDAKSLVQTELREAKEAISSSMADAERMVRSGLRDAKETVKDELKDAVTKAKDSLRAATVGRVETFATQVGDKMNDARDSLLDTIYNNPLPATLAGVGIAWLLMNRSRSASTRGYAGNGMSPYGSRQRSGVGETVGQGGAALGQATQRAGGAVAQGVQGVTDTAGELLDSASGMASNLAHTAAEGVSQAARTVSEGASTLADRAQSSAKRVERTFERQLRERPLAVGAAAVAFGTAIGCALPRTSAEDELMGETRDKILSNAGDAVHEAAAAVGLEGEERSAASGQTRQVESGGPGAGADTTASRAATKQQPQRSEGGEGKQGDQRSRRDAEGTTGRS